MKIQPSLIGTTFVHGRNMLIGSNTVILDLKQGGTRSGMWVYDLDQKKVTACLPEPSYLGTAFSADSRTLATWKRFRPTDILIWDLTQLP